MPLYEYECTQCKRHTEKIQKFSDAEITVCPHCGGLLERVITAPAISFKGGGWFKDGYGNSAPAASKPESSGSDSSPSTSSTDTPSPSTGTSAPAPSAPAPAPAASTTSSSDTK